MTARAEYLGSGLLHQGCRPDPSQFIGVFAQNRPEVTRSALSQPSAAVSQTNEALTFDLPTDFSGSSQSWPATPTPWWWFRCTTRWAPTPSGSSLTPVRTHTHTRQHEGCFICIGSRCFLRPRVVSADISTVICDKVDKAQVLLDNVERKETPGLRRIILMDGFESDLVRRGEGCGVLVQAMQEVEVHFDGLFTLTVAAL